MSCGLVLAPETPVDVLLPLADLLSGPDPVVEFVDILAVRPGVGNQKANMKVALEKVTSVRRQFPGLPFVGVDGGVNENTISQAVAAGANFLICGTAIFGAERRHEQGEERMRSRMIKLTSLAIGGLEYSNE
jgi:ribulose-phosphate 3-epimerase